MGLFDIITVGSNTLDVFVTTDTELVKLSSQDKSGNDKKEVYLAYPLGAKILITDLHFEIGGAGTNTAVSFSRLGLKTGYLGKIGRDNNGMQVFNLLHKEKIHFLGSFGDKTGYSVVLDSKVSDRTILTFKGCNDDLKYAALDKNNLKTKWFYFGSMTGQSFKALNDISKLAERKKIKIAFNPSRYLVLKGLGAMRTIFKNTNILVLNKEEAEILSGKYEIDDILVSLKKYIKDHVIVTDGKRGIWCFDGDKVIHALPRKKLKVVETTGAGDAFASAFTSGIIYEKGVKNSVRMGMIQAESVIQSLGAKNILLSKKQMSILLKKDKRVILERLIKR